MPLNPTPALSATRTARATDPPASAPAVATVTAAATDTPNPSPSPTAAPPTPTAPQPQWIAFESKRGEHGDYEIVVTPFAMNCENGGVQHRRSRTG